MNRPTGVTVLAVLQFIGAAFCVMAALAFMVGGTLMGGLLGSAAAGRGGGTAMAGMGAVIGAVGGVFFLVMAVVYGFVGWGMWSLKSWARVVTIVLAAIGAAFQVLGLLGSLMHFRIFGMLWNVIWIGVNAMIIWYLVQPHIKAAFEGGRQVQAVGM